MLVLTRRTGEKIRINDDTVITILGFRDNQFRIGIEAPRSVPVNREEVWQRTNGTASASTHPVKS